MRKLKLMVVIAVLAMVAGSTMASNFRSGDLVYLPAVARLQGGAFFNTDVVIANVNSSPVVVSIVYAPTGVDNSTVTSGPNVRDITLAAQERREIIDVMKTVFNLDAANGFLLFFACKQGGNCSSTCTTNPTDPRSITVEGRIYVQKTDGSTFGQLFSGYPWYSYVSTNDAAKFLDKVTIAGVRVSGSLGVSGFRTNLGIVNASVDYRSPMLITLFNNNGTVFGTKTVDLAPLQHFQKAITDPSLFPTFSGSGYIQLEQVSPPLAPGGCSQGTPGFLAYGSLLDNVTSDPTTLETQYNIDLPIDCVYGTAKSTARRPARRP
ncbi:MAG TPA: hypothetical protein VHL58_19955 [Thermoanaerobaculia bacterium]|nr:hypothetical protein [Thermoanaerobaculia bacterium]